MNFIGCDGSWMLNLQGAITCNGTLRSITSDEMSQLFGSGHAATQGLPLAQLVEYGIYYGLSYWAIFFLFGQVRKALDL